MGKTFSYFLFTLILMFGYCGESFSNVDTWGLGARSSSMGGAFTAVADDFTAAWYNPAGLAQYKGNRFTMNRFFVKPDLQVKTLDGENLVVRSGGALNFITNDPVNGASGSPNLNISTIGIELNLNSAIKRFLNMNLPWNTQFGLAFGIADELAITLLPPDQPHFINFGEFGESPTFVVTLGIELMKDFLYAGIGANPSGAATAVIFANNIKLFGDTEKNKTPFAGAFPMSGEMVPIGGLLITPFNKKVKIGFSYRHDYILLDMAPFGLIGSVALNEESDAKLPLYGYFQCWYFPEEYNLGISIDLNPFLISFDINRQMWSEYDYNTTEQMHYTGELTVGYEPGSPDFDDTIEYRAGLEYEYSDQISMRGGYMHAVSPVPDQCGRVSNYLDMDQNIFSLGASYAFKTRPVVLSFVTKYFTFDGFTVYKNQIQGYTFGRTEFQPSYEVPSGNIIMIGGEMRLSF